MRKLIFLLFLLPLLLMATTTDISDQIGQIELTSPAENQFLTYYDDSGNLILINSDDLELDEMILDSLYVRAINIESDGTGAKLTITGKTDTGADAVIILSATGATAVQGLKLWYDRSTAYGYIDNQYNNDAGNIYIRTKTAGTPINAISILGTGKVSMVGDLDVGGVVYTDELEEVTAAAGITLNSELNCGNSYWGLNPGSVIANYMNISAASGDGVTHGLVLAQLGGYNMITTTRDSDGAGDSDTPLTTILGDLTVSGDITQKIWSGAITDGTPTAAEINTITSLTPSTAGAGWTALIEDASTDAIYRVISDGTSWHYVILIVAS